MKRIYHTWDKWECYPAGFYEKKHPDKSISDEQCRQFYAAFLSDIAKFKAGMSRVISEWPNSCEHYLSNERMNRIAWLGQAAMCIMTGSPSTFKGGYFRLSEIEQQLADASALEFLNLWLEQRGEPPLSMEEAQSKTEANLY